MVFADLRLSYRSEKIIKIVIPYTERKEKVI
jgi:hypothetical protein